MILLAGSGTERCGCCNNRRCVLIYNIYKLSTGPYSHSSVPATLNKIAIFYPDTLDGGTPRVVVFVGTHTRAAVPVTTVSLVVHFDHILASCGNNVARVEHHAGHGVIVGVGIVN
jgi:hypothetical protein